jgi:hypothetical protein
MNDAPRFVLNRSVMLLIYKQPFLDWLHSADPTPALTWTLEDLHNDNDTFLIPQFDDPRDSVKWVEKRWRSLFDSILVDWLADDALWPKKRTLKLFREWFDIQIHSLVWDLANEPLTIEDWGGDDEADDVPKGMLH